MITREQLIGVLQDASEPLTVADIAAQTGGEISECDELLWQNPDDFVWQPGHKWTIANAKHWRAESAQVDTPDARSSLMSASAPKELRAFTMASGLTVAVNRRPLDTDAFFTVRSAGNTITLTLNSTHELFTDLPIPFETDGHDAGFQRICEILLSAWALYEDGLPGGSAKRATEDARLLWGRRAMEILREGKA